MNEQFSRTAMQFGWDGVERLFAARVAVFGIGGVGGYTAEALARAGVGTLDLYDKDTVCQSNINRQIVALHSTVGLYKVDCMKQRILDINPAAVVGAHRMFYLPDTADGVDLSRYDYVVDAVDTMTAKLELVCRAAAAGVPIISAMGAANKLDPTAFVVDDIYSTSACPMARIMRRELKKRGIASLKVVYSTEPALTPIDDGDSCAEQESSRRVTPSSNPFVPPVAGLIIAGEVIKDLTAR